MSITENSLKTVFALFGKENPSVQIRDAEPHTIVLRSVSNNIDIQRSGHIQGPPGFATTVQKVLEIGCGLGTTEPNCQSRSDTGNRLTDAAVATWP